jgi:hypothetical protein
MTGSSLSFFLVTDMKEAEFIICSNCNEASPPPKKAVFRFLKCPRCRADITMLIPVKLWEMTCGVCSQKFWIRPPWINHAVCCPHCKAVRVVLEKIEELTARQLDEMRKDAFEATEYAPNGIVSTQLRRRYLMHAFGCCLGITLLIISSIALICWKLFRAKR